MPADWSSDGPAAESGSNRPRNGANRSRPQCQGKRTCARNLFTSGHGGGGRKRASRRLASPLIVGACNVPAHAIVPVTQSTFGPSAPFVRARSRGRARGQSRARENGFAWSSAGPASNRFFSSRTGKTRARQPDWRSRRTRWHPLRSGCRPVDHENRLNFSSAPAQRFRAGSSSSPARQAGGQRRRACHRGFRSQ